MCGLQTVRPYAKMKPQAKEDTAVTKVYFSFDTEDFTSNYASDAVRDQARILHEYGVKGNFNVVGYLAREFVRNRRFDVLDELKNHTVSFHSLRHSYHPTICEYTDLEDYAAAREEFLRQEDQGMGMVKAATGVDSFPAAVPPGSSLSYVAMYNYVDRGIPLYLGSLFSTEDGTGVFYCNGFHMDYHYAMENLFCDDPAFDMDEFIEKLAGFKRVIVYNHPNKVLYSVFWDQPNYKKKNVHPMYQWEEPPRRTPEAVKGYYDRLRDLLARLTSDSRFCVSSVDALREEALAMDKGRIVTKDMLPQIRKALEREFTWMSSPVSLSVADCFYAAKHFMDAGTPWEAGKVHGFLYAPEGVKEETVISAATVRALAAQCSPEKFLPPYFEAEGKRIGPADLLFAMLDVAEGAESVTLKPRAQQCDYSRLPALRDVRLGEWMEGDDFGNRWLSERLRLQAWTIRTEA